MSWNKISWFTFYTGIISNGVLFIIYENYHPGFIKEKNFMINNPYIYISIESNLEIKLLRKYIKFWSQF